MTSPFQGFLDSMFPLQDSLTYGGLGDNDNDEEDNDDHDHDADDHDHDNDDVVSGMLLGLRMPFQQL